jgi:pimeloyl-ACP methyl ester carboxylesterase
MLVHNTHPMKAQSNGIEIEYESMGDPRNPALLMISGFSVQLIAWDDDFCRMIVERGFRLIRFDNRDVGLSTKYTRGTYSLDDMAEDARGLLDWLGVPRAHVVGQSMGGMIAQLLAIRHPTRVRTLCSIMSTTGEPSVGGATPQALAALMRPPPTSREEAIERIEEILKVIGSTGFPLDFARIRDRAARSFDRCFYPLGATRQLLAVQTAPPRTEALRKLRMPTLVIHGEADPLVSVTGGKATAAAIPGSELLIFPGMGHELPRPLWPQLVDAIARNTQRAAE